MLNFPPVQKYRWNSIFCPPVMNPKPKQSLNPQLANTHPNNNHSSHVTWHAQWVHTRLLVFTTRAPSSNYPSTLPSLLAIMRKTRSTGPDEDGSLTSGPFFTRLIWQQYGFFWDVLLSRNFIFRSLSLTFSLLPYFSCVCWLPTADLAIFYFYMYCFTGSIHQR